MSLIQILRDDPDFGFRMERKAKEIKQDRQNILSAADEYSKRYESEIEEGTKLKAKLLSEGSSRGLKEEDVLSSYGRFVPARNTPILNLLYFLLRESEGDPVFGKSQYQRRDIINERLIQTKQLDHEDTNVDLNEADINELLDHAQKVMSDKTKNEDRSRINKLFDELKKDKPSEDNANLKDTPEMINYLYGNIDLKMFNTIKKLKALATSKNLDEATAAFKKGRELCSKFNLEWERIPCYVKEQEE